MLCSINNSYALQGKDMPKKKKGEYSVDADNNGSTKSDINEVKKIYIIGIPHIGFELLGAFQIYNEKSERLTEDKVMLNWYRDGEIIPGENAHTYVVKEGDYLHEISFGISHAGDNIMMSNPMHIKDGDETNTGIYISTEIGESYSTAACTSNSNCDESSFIYGFGLGYEIGKFAFDVKYNNVTPRYRKFQYVDSIETREMYVGVRYKAWNKDNLAISLGGGFGHWTSLHTGDIVNGTHTYNQ
jgi:hypothetical protein